MPHMKWWTGQSLIVERFMATTATVPPQRLSDVEWSKRVRTRQVEVVICGGADSDMTWHGVSQNGKPRLPPFHSRVWQTSPFLEMLCHYVMIVMAVDGGVSQWYSCLFSVTACKNLGRCHASGRPAYLLVLPYFFTFMVSGKCQPGEENSVQTFLELARSEPE